MSTTAATKSDPRQQRRGRRLEPRRPLRRASTTRAIDRDLDAAPARARAFETRYRGKIDTPGGPAAEGLARRAASSWKSCPSRWTARSSIASLLHAAQLRRPAPRRPAGAHPRAAHRHQQAPHLLRPGMDQGRRRRRHPTPRRHRTGPLPPLPGAETRSGSRTT